MPTLLGRKKAFSKPFILLSQLDMKKKVGMKKTGRKFGLESLKRQSSLRDDNLILNFLSF